MEAAGELEYYSVPWEDMLQHQPWRPAGPLYSIRCLQGTLVQLHLPHCEILSGVSEDFFQRHKGTLKERLPFLEPIINKLFEKKVLNTTEMEKIQNQGTSFNKNVSLVDIVDKKGPDAQAIFCQVLQKEDPYLCMDLAKQ
ncbi:hypothetical protein ACEWY4_024884 [Coilia grayii]|uniref:CARD domain-containing protein n=1 Tax=Coilia grayii TaxID=363190 RepID=A0ABD1IYP9_9TELE